MKHLQPIFLRKSPFPDESFDVAVANSVLMHLREPVRALAVLRRVLRPDCIAGVREPDLGASLYAPATPLLEQWLAAGASQAAQRRRAVLEPPLSPIVAIWSDPTSPSDPGLFEDQGGY